MRLLADCGNSAVKLALEESRVLSRPVRVEATAAALSGFLGDTTIEEVVILPTATAAAQQVRAWSKANGVRTRTIGTELALPDLGQYASCGIDRVLAGLAATTTERQGLIVLDAGTATTLTAWDWADGAAHFLGGLIAPGAQACALGLHTAAPALPLVEPLGPDAHALQHDTRAAIAAAIGIGYGPMIAACLIKLERESGIHDVRATGGGVELLLRSNVVRASDLRANLVLDGMALLADG